MANDFSENQNPPLNWHGFGYNFKTNKYFFKNKISANTNSFWHKVIKAVHKVYVTREKRPVDQVNQMS